MNRPIRPRRLLVSGGGHLPAQAAALWTELGRRLAAEQGLVVLTGGLLEVIDYPGKPADWAVIEGMLEGLRAAGVAPEDRIETLLPDPKSDWSQLKRFQAGRVRVLERRTAQSRRFSMVRDVDVVSAIEGGTGTRSVLDMAV